MRINFVLPRSTNTPMGGYKVVFQYANYFSDKGHDVHIYFVINAKINSLNLWRAKISGLVLKQNIYRHISWFNLRSNIHVHFDVSSNTIRNINHGTVIATHWSTARLVLASNVKEKHKFYFIQAFESFDPSATKKDIEDTWRLGLNNIVISKWLQKKARELDVKATLITNFIDHNEFNITNLLPNNQRENIVSFLWHTNPDKQSSIGLEVLKKVKDVFPDLKIIEFGAANSGESIISESYLNADSECLSNNIYGKSAIYFMPSSSEGWGLTGLEAMYHGAAVVSVNNGGITEYATNGQSAVIVENNKEAMYQGIIKLLEDKKYRQLLVNNGIDVANKFSLTKSGDKFISVLGGGNDE
ncbi:glycosyltransferase family 4 protein [Latilactobacillus sp. 5-91]|uniref:glycosyltransferase family 4 protein n=1 Tax=Latilactobacillus sp. 5-91 TaxID=3410924 RepID=UPI003C736783